MPFCMRRCGYCDFNTYTAPDLGEGASRGNYARMAVREMELVRAWQVANGIEEPAACSVFFGGGTPTILPAADLVTMLDAVRRIWGLEPGAEVTTEANPDTVDADYIKRLADGGFTRISFGMQSAVPSVLRTLDRRHTPANVEAGVRAADACGLRSSVDLIYGAPGESLEDWRTSVRAAVDLGVNHISAYALTIAPRTRMGRMIAAGRLPKPSDDDEAAKYEIADEAFAAAGLTWYEISNWARPGFESRHNLGYWRNVDWAGIGPGAHSHYRFVGRGSNKSATRVLLGDTDSGHERDSSLAQNSQRVQDSSNTRDAGVTANATSADDTATVNATAAQSTVAADGTTSAETAESAQVTTAAQTTAAAQDTGIESATAAQSADASPVGMRAWDTAHPRAWGRQINAATVPWAGSEAITARQDAEETLMLGLRLHEGFDTARFAGIIPLEAWRQLESEGLIHLVPGPHGSDGLSDSSGLLAVPTLRGRLLNDLIIERLFDYL
ncbi:radical SAM family heme chaperone HemW [Pseudoscardovia suis]